VTADPVEVSEQFLRAIRYEEPTASHEETLAAYDSDDLAAGLDTDGGRIAFWCNLYNGATQLLLEDKPETYEKRRKFFSLPAITVAGKSLSLDDIEHRILRRSYSKLTLGYIRNPFRGAFARQHELSKRDPRIHFVLNCGAESCPPIAAYTREAIDDQLDMATAGYLETAVEYDPDAGTAHVPRLMLWFRADFGGKSGILSVLREYDQIPRNETPSLSYKDWSWSLAPGDFADEDEREATAPQQD
jgi:hypothetical protein